MTVDTPFLLSRSAKTKCMHAAFIPHALRLLFTHCALSVCRLHCPHAHAASPPPPHTEARHAAWPRRTHVCVMATASVFCSRFRDASPWVAPCAVEPCDALLALLCFAVLAVQPPLPPYLHPALSPRLSAPCFVVSARLRPPRHAAYCPLHPRKCAPPPPHVLSRARPSLPPLPRPHRTCFCRILVFGLRAGRLRCAPPCPHLFFTPRLPLSGVRACAALCMLLGDR